MNGVETTIMDAKQKKLITSLAVGALGGFVVAFGLTKTIQTGALGDLDLSRSIAAMVGAVYVLCGGFVGFGVLNPKLGAKFLNVEDAEELEEQYAMLRNSSLGIIAYGLSLILLAIAAPIGPVPEVVVGGGILVLMVVATLTSLSTLKAMDELNASLTRDTSVYSFYLVLCLGGGWSILAHLGFVPPLAPLDWLTLFAAVMLAAAFWASGRRGLLAPR